MNVVNKVHINKYLVGGNLIEWKGKKTEIYSVIKNDKNSPTLLGSVPNLDENAAISAIEQADLAYNRGRGQMAYNECPNTN